MRRVRVEPRLGEVEQSGADQCETEDNEEPPQPRPAEVWGRARVEDQRTQRVDLATGAECATRRGRPYGIILMNAETRRPVDLLPDREASAA